MIYTNYNSQRGSAAVATIVVVLIIVVAAVVYFVNQQPLTEEAGNASDTTLNQDVKDKMMPASPDGSKGGEDDATDDNMMGDDTISDENKMAEDEAISEVKIFDITGVNFAFSVKEIRVKQGDKVKIVLTSDDGFHDWKIDEFNAATARVNTGQTAEVEFTADTKGTFEYYCSVGQHRQLGMVGKLIVE